jgi:hypothetical protein
VAASIEAGLPQRVLKNDFRPPDWPARERHRARFDALAAAHFSGAR